MSNKRNTSSKLLLSNEFLEWEIELDKMPRSSAFKNKLTGNRIVFEKITHNGHSIAPLRFNLKTVSL